MCCGRHEIRLQIIKIISKIMKNFFIGAFATVCFVLNVSAQKNNPFNSVGSEFVKSLKILQSDYDNGKIKSIDQKTTDYYLNTLPSKAQVNSEVVSATVSAMKNSNYTETVKNSKLSSFSKNILLKSQQNSADITALVEQVKNQKLETSENELVLTSLAITYNLSQTQALSRCSVNGQTGPNACQAAGALVGLTIGSAICGPLCGVGGAIIGAIFGSTKD